MVIEISASKIILRGIEEVVNLLKEQKIDYAVLGGMALAVWGRERVSRDIDIVISVKEDKLEGLINSLKKPPFSIRTALKSLGDSLLIFATYEDVETEFRINVDLFIAQTPFQKVALKRSKEIEGLEQKIKIVSVEDLILYKLLADRPIDLIDAEVLIEQNKDQIDRTYLKNWAKKLSLMRKLNKLLKSNV